MSLSTVLAKALFDNAAESPEELAFRKGDILMVLEQEQGGGPGWWLCSLHGRQGIAPANRLRLLHTTPGSDPQPPSRAPSEDSVYLSPGPLARTAVSTEDIDGVYRTPPSLGEALYQSPGAVPVASRPGVLRQAEVGGRPRSRSSSGTRPLPEWDGGVTGRPRSPSLRGRDVDSAGTLYQTPSTPTLLGPQHHRSPGGLTGVPGPENVYLAPSGMPRAVGLAPEGPEDNTYLVPRETVAAAGHSDSCYLVPRGTVLPSEEFYQTPTGGAAGVAVATQVTPIATRILETQSLTPSQVNGDRGAPLKPLTPHSKLAQGTPGMMYQTPTHVGAGILRTPPVPALGSPKPQLKGVIPRTPRGQSGVPSTPPIARGKLAPATPVRGSPLLARPGQGQGRVPRSPNFARKPPPPAPPVRGVTRKDLPQPGTPVSTSKPAISTPQSTPVPLQQESKDGRMTSDEKKKNGQNKKGEGREYADPDDENLDEQVYDTPPSSRWHRQAPAVLCDDENIYNTPRSLPPHTDLESEVYNVPTIILSTSSDPQQQTYNVQASVTTAESEEDVYSVPSLPGLPLAPGDMSTIIPLEETEHGQVYSVLGQGKRAPLGLGEGSDLGSTSEPDCGIYNMPALTLDVLPSSAMSTSSSTHRLSVSSNGSGDIQWRSSLSSLVQSVLSTASGAPASSRDLATSLAEILSVWKLSQPSEVPPSLQLAWARLSDLLPALSSCGHAPPSDTLLSMVQRALEDSTILLQTQGRPRLPSQDSLSRRPLPALPVAEIKPVGSGMGPRKSSWIQERPLPPTPQPAFPLPLAQPSMTMSITVGQSDGEEEMGNEYAGIGLTPAPAPLPVGDSVGYVKLQGKPEPPSDVQTENVSNQTVHTTEPRLSPSPPLPISLSLEDSELLSFYSSQSLSHLSCLADSIDVLFNSVQGNQPPRVFVSRGKSLIVTAHKLVFIGDTLSRLLTSPDLRAKVTTSGGRLCQALKAVVVATKGAAQNYPSVSATQEMVDRVAELSQHAAGFSSLLKRLAEIS
ncbi:breast cancer anti-estrogen resistance protein 1-like [Oncorhynchus clarkii lewisi]|uniref:breast cancer anti-estrogen resistance protein 1-like n=1 Tax=Oncorhynchus clarkii lewisi TaxID=490388 RepID=UPI0039B8EB58